MYSIVFHQYVLQLIHMPSVVPSSDRVPPEESCQSCGVHDNVQCIALQKLWFVMSIDYPAVRREFLERLQHF